MDYVLGEYVALIPLVKIIYTRALIDNKVV